MLMWEQVWVRLAAAVGVGLFCGWVALQGGVWPASAEGWVAAGSVVRIAVEVWPVVGLWWLGGVGLWPAAVGGGGVVAAGAGMALLLLLVYVAGVDGGVRGGVGVGGGAGGGVGRGRGTDSGSDRRAGGGVRLG